MDYLLRLRILRYRQTPNALIRVKAHACSVSIQTFTLVHSPILPIFRIQDLSGRLCLYVFYFFCLCHKLICFVLVCKNTNKSPNSQTNLHKLKLCLAKVEQNLAVSLFFLSFALGYETIHFPLHSVMKQKETILTITGSDSTGGSGVQADIRTISAMGGRAVSAITSITVQNSLGIQEFFDLPPQVVEGQIEAVVNDVEPQVVKVGMLRTVELVHAVAGMLRKYKPRYVVYDPIVKSSKGDELMSAEVVASVKEWLLPLCSYVVERSEQATHGHGNLLSSAVCVYLSEGAPLDEAVRQAHDYLRGLPASDGENAGRSGELYAAFMENVERFYRHYSDVAFYAEQLNVSSRYLAQVTRRMASRSPKALIDERILQEVVQLLTTTRHPLKEIASELGFSSQAHLARFFHKQKGCSPTAFRQRS